MTRIDYFADFQMKRFLVQMVKAFSGYQYKTGRIINGSPELRVVPCRMAAQNRMVEHLKRNGSENTLLSVPMITISQTGLTINKGQANNAIHVDKLKVAERARDQNGKYTGERGQSYTVERLMPRPFTMTIQVDIWTSNMDQKHQLLEQILVVTSVPFDIQNSDNALDWSALTMMVMTDISLTTRSVNIGTEDEIDVATLTFEVPFYLNPPAKVTRQVLINQINAQVGFDLDNPGGTGDDLFVREIITLNDHQVAIQRGVITLLDHAGLDTDPDGNVFTWDGFFKANGARLQPATTQLRLRKNLDDDNRDIIGTLQVGDQPNQLVWQIDPETLPSNSIQPINGIVRPLTNSPGTTLPAAANGQRYIIFEDISSTAAWGEVNARANDIIAYQNGKWSVVFEAATAPPAYVLNQTTSTQLYWTGEAWEKSIDGLYGPGHWRIFS